MPDRSTILITALLLLSGCSASETTISPIDSKVITEEAYSIHGDSVAVIKLKDGTRCVLYQGYEAGGLSCDWSHHD